MQGQSHKCTTSVDNVGFHIWEGIENFGVITGGNQAQSASHHNFRGIWDFLGGIFPPLTAGSEIITALL